MATLVVQPESITEKFGPHLSKSTGMRLDPGVVPDKVVETHCCFCGQQCGIQLLVKHNQVIGYEPWYEFPFNKGKLCPKGVKRYLQGAHPDRLLHAYKRDPANPHGFSPVPYEKAIRKVAEEIDRIQKKYGPSAFASLSGASLTTEKTYLMGKFARVCLKTPYTDYNGRLCMVSAGAGNKKAFGVDRAANPWDDILKAEVIWISGANVAECAPITTDYVWQARENGGKIIVIDPRITPIGRTCDLLLPIKPGRDVALFNGILHLMIKNDWVDHSFIQNYTVGFDELAASVEEWTPERTAKVTGIAEKGIRQAAEWWGTAKTSFLMHARGIEHSSHGVQNVLGAINIVMASGRIGRESCGYGTITGQGNGQGGREHGQKCDQLPGARDIGNPEHRKYIAEVWGVSEKSIPHKGLSMVPIVEAIHDGKIKGLMAISCNPMVSLPNNAYAREAYEKLEFFCQVDFFLSESARYADVVLAGSLMEEDEGTTTNVEGRVIHHKKVIDPPGNARADWTIICDLAARLGASDKFKYNSPKDIFEELRVASKGGIADYYGITWERIDREKGVFWPCPSADHPGTPRLYEGNKFNHPDGKAHFHPVEWQPAAEETDSEYPIILTTGRVVSHYLSGTQTRRIGALIDQYP